VKEVRTHEPVRTHELVRTHEPSLTIHKTFCKKGKRCLINFVKRVGLAARQVHGIILTPGPKGFFSKCFMFLVENFGVLQ